MTAVPGLEETAIVAIQDLWPLRAQPRVRMEIRYRVGVIRDVRRVRREANGGVLASDEWRRARLLERARRGWP